MNYATEIDGHKLLSLTKKNSLNTYDTSECTGSIMMSDGLDCR